jgi:hypothetical protein
MRGAGQCPKCGSRKVGRAPFPTEQCGSFYSRTLEFCRNPACKAAWEPFDPADLLDAGVFTSSFKEPCENCAFRPGSVEQQNVEEWKKTMAALKLGGSFNCHKGVPLDPAGENGFAYPHDRNGQLVGKKLRLCRGWLMMWGQQMDKKYGWPAHGEIQETVDAF